MLTVEEGWLDDPVALEAAVTVEMPVIVVVLLHDRGTMSVDETKVTSAHCSAGHFRSGLFNVGESISSKGAPDTANRRRH